MDSIGSSKDSGKGAQSKDKQKVDSSDLEIPVKPTQAVSCFPVFQEHEENDDDSLLNKSEFHQEELRLLAHGGILDDLYLDVVSPPFQVLGEDATTLPFVQSQHSRPIEPYEEKSWAFPSASLEILKRCRSRLSTVNGRKLNGLLSDSKQHGSTLRLSTNHIIELAAGNFIQSNSTTMNELSAISHPYASSLLSLWTGNAKDVHLVQDLLSCAEKVGNQQYTCASKLLEECNKLSSSKISAIQRLVHCFTEALQEKIDRETGRFTGKRKFSFDMITPSSATVALQRNLPIVQVVIFTCIQTIMDHLSASTSRRIHIIDLQIHCALLMVILMQELASRSDHPLEHFKITAVATKSKSLIEKASVHIKSMAESLNLNFSFNVVELDDIIRHQQSLFDLDPEEAVIVHSNYALQYMISKPDQLEVLIRSIISTNPLAMIITETESNVNSPVFVNRFVEALFFYGAYFDCMEDCLKNDAADRAMAEASLFNPAIRNIVAAEGEDRNVRTVGINIWRAFLAKFGMVETELSKASLNQANLMREIIGFGNSCTLSLHGNCLMIGWKGTPLCSISAWNFHGSSRSTRRI